MPLVIPANSTEELVVSLKVSAHGHEFYDEATVYLEDNGRLREYKLPIKGTATPEPVASS